MMIELEGYGHIRLVIAYNLKEEKGDGGPINVKYIIDPSLKGSNIISICKMRRKIESYSRAEKQNLGLGQYHGCKFSGLVVHVDMHSLYLTTTD